MTKHRHIKFGGFSLVEVLIIISVIGILASISYMGYSNYTQNANRATIATTAQAYRFSLKSYANETESYPNHSFCLPAGSECCYSSSSSVTTVRCGNDAEAVWGTTPLVNDVSKYVTNPPPKLPVFSSFPDCVVGLLTNDPCKPTATIPVVGLAYIINPTAPLYTSADPLIKGFLIYYVDLNYDCNSSNVTILSAGALSIDTSAKFTRERTSSSPTYRECIIAVRSVD